MSVTIFAICGIIYSGVNSHFSFDRLKAAILLFSFFLLEFSIVERLYYETRKLPHNSIKLIIVQRVIFMISLSNTEQMNKNISVLNIPFLVYFLTLFSKEQYKVCLLGSMDK